MLRLLDEVSYDGSPVTGSRPADLLAALVLHPTGVSDLRLVDEVWRDDPPAIPGKALQVLVSRLRTQLGAEAVSRADGGYRLALESDAVDAWVLECLVTDAGHGAGRGPTRSRRSCCAEAAAGLLAACRRRRRGRARWRGSAGSRSAAPPPSCAVRGSP